MEAWAPSRGVCGREGVAPDFHFLMKNEQMHRADKVAFNPVLVLAAALSPDAAYRSSFRDAAAALAAYVDARLFVTRVRPWACRFATGWDAFHRSIDDFSWGGGLFKTGNRHERPVDAHIFDEEWQVLV
jgi:hypothetical protein